MYYEGVPKVMRKELSKDATQHRWDNPDCFLLSKSMVLTGVGKAIVCAVGKNTRIHEMIENEMLKEGDELTPLQEKLGNLAGQIGKFAYLGGALIFIGMTLFLVLKIIFSDSELMNNETLMKILQIFSTAVAIIIMAVPEGLPLAISISMAFSIDNMKKDNLLVKNMEAVETLGQIREICTGKTATLTENKMTVNRFYASGQLVINEGACLNTNILDEKVVEIIKDCIIINNAARVEMSEDAYYEV
jgi:magnesium-transporting ATPase (P-type)